MSRSLLPHSRRRALVIAGVLALSLHALGLSWQQLREHRRPPEESLRPRDNTEDLLQFAIPSDAPAGLQTPALPLTPLLPPPQGLPATRGRHGEGKAGTLTPAGRRSTRGASSAAAAVAGQRRAPSHPPKAERRERIGNQKTGRDSDSVGNFVGGGFSEEWSEAFERLRRVRRQPAVPGGTAPVLLDPPSPGSKLPEAYMRLWDQARPETVSVQGQAEVEVRQVRWPAVRAAELPIRHGQVIPFPGFVMMLWFQGDHLYLLRSPRLQDGGP